MGFTEKFKLFPMSIDPVRFRNAREKKGLSQPKLAALSGVSQTTIDKIERGLTLNSRMLPKLALALGVPIEELDPQLQNTASTGFRPPPEFFSRDNNMPVFSAAEGGNGHIIVSTDVVEYVQRPYTLETISDAYGILIVGDSMDPAFEPGDTAWVNPRLPPLRGVDVILYAGIDGGADARASIKRLIGWTDKVWQVRQYNPPKEFTMERSEWPKVHRVVGKFSRR